MVFHWVPDQIQGLDGNILAFGPAAKLTAGLTAWMAIWWLTEAIPVYATALLPLALLPLSGEYAIKQVAISYAHPIIFLFLGGFILALALEKWELHKRFALRVIRTTGTQPVVIIGGFMLVSALLSMWITNTATTMVMLPIALSIVRLHPDNADKRNFTLCLLLGIAYAASIGGIGTLIGTVPNMFTASFTEQHLAIELGFVQWMQVGVPIVITLVPLAWLLLTRVIYPPGTQPIENTREELKTAPWCSGSRITLGIFLLTATAWITRPLLNQLPLLSGLTDSGIAVIAALLLFITPVSLKKAEFLIDWQTVERLPWGILLLLSGGIALASAITKFGISELLASQLSQFAEVSPILMTLLVVTLIIFLTEITSNTATTTSLVPVLAAMAVGMGLDPLSVIIPATIAASCAFMLPVATPPNAIVFGSQLIQIPQMAKAGVWLNILAIAVITLLSQPQLKAFG